MIILTGSHVKLLSRAAQHILDLWNLLFKSHQSRSWITILDWNLIQVFLQKLCLTLLFLCEFIIRFLNQKQLFIYYLQRAFEFFLAYLKSKSLLTWSSCLLFRVVELLGQNLIFLVKILTAFSESINLVRQWIVFRLYLYIKCFLIEVLFLQCFIAFSVSFVLFHHNVVVAFEQINDWIWVAVWVLILARLA